ncbi:MAG: hypothetical protein MJ230_00205 [bacterium]|nr:hypothetical protein [bacterium]
MVMSFGGMGMCGFGMSGMSGYGGGNVYQSLKAKYGAPADFHERPSVAPYPMECIPMAPEPVIQRTRFGRFLNKLYG